jgi:hypothetical protein
MSAIITEWQDGVTDWSAATMNVPIALLDKYVALHHNLIVSCDGDITFNESTGSLAWSAPLRIVFINADGVSVLNTIALGDITVGTNQYVYADLNQTDGTTILAGVATLTNGGAAAQLAVARLVLGYRNAVSSAFYPAALSTVFGSSASNVLHNYSATTDPTVDDDAVAGYAETSEWVNTVTNEIFKCIDATSAAANWISITVASVVTQEHITIACSDETTDLTTGLAKVTFRMPYAFTLSAVRASTTTAPTGANLVVDINEGGTTILSTKLSIDAGEKTSTTALTAVVISDAALADDAEITIDIDQIGSTVAGTGLKVTLIGVKS